MARFSKSTIPLAGNAVWTSDDLLGEQADNIAGLVFTDQSGTLTIRQSIDGVNYDITDTIAVTGGTPLRFSAQVVAPSVRVVYTNGATPQTVFRLSTKFSSAGPR